MAGASHDASKTGRSAPPLRQSQSEVAALVEGCGSWQTGGGCPASACCLPYPIACSAAPPSCLILFSCLLSKGREGEGGPHLFLQCQKEIKERKRSPLPHRLPCLAPFQNRWVAEQLVSRRTAFLLPGFSSPCQVIRGRELEAELEAAMESRRFTLLLCPGSCTHVKMRLCNLVTTLDARPATARPGDKILSMWNCWCDFPLWLCPSCHRDSPLRIMKVLALLTIQALGHV